MSWEDYVPLVGPAYEAAKGNYKGAAGDLLLPGLYPAYEQYKGAVDEQKQGDLTAAAQASALGTNLYTEALGGLGQAESYYGPAAAMLKNAYGSPGTMTGGPGQYPLAPAPASPK